MQNGQFMHNDNEASSKRVPSRRTPSINLVSDRTKSAPPVNPLEQFSSATKLDSDLEVLALEVWRIERRLEKASELSETNARGLRSSVQKLGKVLEKNQVEVRDYTDEKYSEGLNVDVLSVENEESAGESRIKETFEPAILHKGKMVKRAKVILTKGVK